MKKINFRSFLHGKKEGFEIMNLRNRQYLESRGIRPEEEESDKTQADDPAEEVAEAQRRQKRYAKENDMGLEKGDTLALIISAFLVFAPIFLIIIGILVVAWILLH